LEEQTIIYEKKHRKFEEKTIIGFQDCIHHSQSQHEHCKIPEVNSGAATTMTYQDLIRACAFYLVIHTDYIE
jgi:hypothetical protein